MRGAPSSLVGGARTDRRRVRGPRRRPEVLALQRFVAHGPVRGRRNDRRRPNLGPMAGRYLIRTYGCQMNEHDSERIAGLLEADGYEAGRPTPTTPTSSCSTPAASARTPTTSSTARWATSRRSRPTGPTCRSWSAAAWPRRTATASSQRAGHVDVVFGTHNVHRAVELLHHAREHGPIVEILEEAVREDAEAFPSALPVRRELGHAAWVTIQVGLRQHLRLLHRARRCGAREISRPFDDLVDRGRGSWRRRASSRSRCSARTSTATAATSPSGARCSPTCCGRSARCPASGGFATRAPIPRTCAPRPSRRWPRRRRCASTCTCRCRAAATACCRPCTGATAPSATSRSSPPPVRPSPTSPSPPTSSSGSPARPTRTSPARSRSRPRPSTTARSRSSSRPARAPRPRTMADRFVPHEVCVERFERLRVVVERSARRQDTRLASAASKRSSSRARASATPACSPAAPGRTSSCTSRATRPLRVGSFADVRVTDGASHYLHGELVAVTAAASSPHPHPPWPSG